MNHIYRLIWNDRLNIWVVASELAPSRRKRGSSKTALGNRLGLCLALGAAFYSDLSVALDDGALPGGGQITSGSGQISQTGHQMTIRQTSPRMSADWQNFDIGQNARVEFQQPSTSSVALNRVVGQNASEIQGKLDANGQVYLINPNGVVFSKTAEVNVGGLVASIHAISDTDFKAGKAVFTRNGGDAGIVNQGHINAKDGVVALIGNTIDNQGQITAQKGDAVLAAGEKVQLDFDGDGLIKVEVDGSAVRAQIDNHGLIQADGAVVMSAKAADELVNSVVNNQGLVQAQGIAHKNGRIILEADDINNSGQLEADASAGSAQISLAATRQIVHTGSATVSGDNSQITLDSGENGNTRVDGQLIANNASGKGGDITVLGKDIQLQANTLIKAQGSGGGTVRVGGDWQGSGTLHQASTVTMEKGASIDASATQQGDGGKVVLWSTETTDFSGNIFAKGAGQGRAGGSAEVSGKGRLNYTGTTNVLGGRYGRTGSLLLDPYNLYIVSGSGGSVTASGNDSILGVDTLTSQLTTANVTVSTGASGAQSGIIGVLTDIISASTHNLTLTAASNVVLDGNVNLGGQFTVNAGGNFVTSIDLANATGVTIAAAGGFVKTGNGTSYLTGNITTSGTDINIAGPVQIANFNGVSNPVTLSTGGGNITLSGAVSNYSGTAQNYAAVMANNLYSGMTASTVTGSSTDVYQSYTTAGSNLFWALPGVSSAQYLVVGGGGGGGNSLSGNFTGGMGGGGGVANGTLSVTSGQNVAVAVGAGGLLHANGGDSSFAGTILSGGGGAGGTYGVAGGGGGTSGNAGNGGAGYTAGGGGGGAGSNIGGTSAGGTGSQRSGGSSGSAGTNPNNVGGGGGGAGGSASNGTGGAGVTSTITGSSVTYGAGGTLNGSVPAVNTGGGSPAIYYGSATGNGADGTVIVRYSVGNGATSATSGLKLSADSGTITLGSSVSNLSSLEVNTSAPTTVATSISGSGTLTNSGAGVLTVTGAATYTGLTTVTSSGIVFTNDAAPTTSGFTGAGTVTIQPSSASFTNAVTAGYTYASTLTGLTLGKSGNTKDIALSSAMNIAGPINLYGGNIYLNADIASGTTSGTGIAIHGTYIAQAAGVDVAASGANIDYLVNNAAFTASADTAIGLYGTSGNRTTINAGGGNVTLNASFAASGTAGGGDDAVQAFYADISTTGNGAISITGDATNISNTAGNNAWGAFLGYSTITTDHGAISLTGIGGYAASASSIGVVVNGADLKLLSSSGAISLTGQTPAGFSGSYTGLYLNPSASANIVIGADGSLVPSSTSNITIIADKADFLINGAYNTQLNTTGAVVVESHAAAFGSTANLTNLSIAGNPSSIRIGKTTNTADVTMGSAISAAGPISIYGGNINQNANLTSTASSADILLKGTGNITQATGTAVTSNGGRIVYWADSDNSGQGYIFLRAGDTLSSSGGKIILAGGLDDGGSNAALTGLSASDGIPDGYAKTTATAGSGSASAAGVSLGPANGSGSSVNLVSGGGDIIVRGLGNSSNDGMGVTSQGNFKIDSGTGTITILGKSTGGSGIEFGYAATPSWAITSASTSSSAIDIEGTSAAAGAAGLWLDDSTPSGSNILIQATGNNGGINLAGISTSSASNAYGLLMVNGSATTQILSQSGQINLIDYTSNSTNDFISNGPLYLGKGVNSTAVNGVTPIISSSANIVLSTDSLTLGGLMTVGTTGTLTVQPYSTTFSSAFTWPASNFSVGSDLSGLTLGKSGNTADITISSALTVAGSVNVYGGNIAVNDGLTASGSNTISLTGTGNVTEGASGFISADKLALLGGNVTLTHANNAIGTLAASGVSGLTYTDSDALTIGTVGSTNGVSATGAVSIGTAAGDLTLTQNVGTTDTTASALIFNAGIGSAAGTATGGNIVLSGSPTLSVGSGGTAKLYTGSIGASTGLTALIGSGSGRFRYNSDESVSNFTQALSSGLNAIYREQPTISAVAVNDQTITYNDALPTWTFSMTGIQNGDTLSQAFSGSPTVTVGGTTSTSGHYTAGGSHSLTASGSLGTSLLGYANTAGGYSAGTLTVSQKTLNVSYTGVDKTYDGTTQATVTTGDDRVTNDVLTISRTAAFADKNAANGVAINVTGVNLAGADSANYTLASATGGTTANITPKTVTLSASKTYDGTTDLTGDVTIDTGISGETLTYTGATASDSHVATANKYISALTLVNQFGATTASGGLASNYQLPTLNTANAPVTIGAKTLLVTYTGVDKTYDGTTQATVTTGDDRVTNDVLTISRTAAFADKNAANGVAINVTGVNLAGADSANYTLASATGGTTANITPKTVTLSASKTYDGTTDLTGDVTIDTGISGETLTYTGATASDSHVATANKYISALTLANQFGATTASGGLASNYQLPTLNTANAPVTIGAKTLLVTYTGVDKTYDGTTQATVTTGDDRVTNDVLTISRTAAFADKNAANGVAINVTGVNLSGADSANYTLASATGGTTANITPKTVTLSASKTYDGTTDLTGDVTIDTGISGETLTYTGATASDSHVATANKYISALTLANQFGATTASGGLASNYQLPTLNTANAPVTIGAKTLLVTYTGVDKTYDGTTQATVTTGDDRVTNDVLTISRTAAFADKNAANGVAINVTGVNLSGADSANYTLASATGGTTANIAPKTVTLSASKTYDGTTDLTGDVTIDTGISGETLTYTGATASDSHVATANKYISALTLANQFGATTASGGLASNYQLPTLNTANAPVTIGAKTLLVTYTGVDKTYDGTTQATVTTGDDRVTNDVLTISRTAAFADKNVGTGKTVSVSGANLTGTDAGNYTLAVSTGSTTANITRLNSVTWIGGAGGNWFNPANWADGAVPDLSNVASVVIPTGVTISFDTSGAVSPAQTGAVNIDSLGATGSLEMSSGTLVVGNGGVTLANFHQIGGTLTDTGNFTISNGFSQSSSGSVTVGGNVSISDNNGGVALGNLTSNGVLSVTSSDGSISQVSGTAIVANSTSRFTATSGGNPDNILLSNTGNEFVGAVSANGATVAIADISALTLGAVTSSGDLNLYSYGALDLGTTTVGGRLTANSHNGDITQASALLVSGITDLNAGSGDVTLTNAANDFDSAVSVMGDAVALTDANALTLGSVTTTSNLDMDSHNALNLGSTSVGGNLSANSHNGDITQSGALTVTGSSNLTTGSGDITLANAANNFSDTVNASGDDINLIDGSDGIISGNVSASGTLGLASRGGGISQAANTVIAVTGLTTLNADNDNINLNGANNNFVGPVYATGNHIGLADGRGGIIFGNVTGNGSLQVTSTGGAITETSNGRIQAGNQTTLLARQAGAPADIILTGDNNDFGGAVNAYGRVVRLSDAHGGLLLGRITSNGLTVISNEGPIDQTADSRIYDAGVTTLSAKRAGNPDDIILNNPGNDFSQVNASGNRVVISDMNGYIEGVIDSRQHTSAQRAIDSLNATRSSIIVTPPDPSGSSVQTATSAAESRATAAEAGAATVTNVQNQSLIATPGSLESMSLDLANGARLVQLSQTSKGLTLTLPDNTATSEPSARSATVTLPVYGSDGQSQYTVQTIDNRFTVTDVQASRHGEVPSITDIGLSSSASLTLADRSIIELTISIGANKILVIDKPKNAAAHLSQQQLLLFGLVVTKQNLDINIATLTGVIIR